MHVVAGGSLKMNVSDEAREPIGGNTCSSESGAKEMAMIRRADESPECTKEAPVTSPDDVSEGFFKDMPKAEKSRSESAGEAAQRKFLAYHSASKLVPERKGSVEMLCWKDVELGRLLDKGSFSCVYEATLSKDKVDPKPTYAVKCLRENVTKQEDTFVTGAVDLALEASILSKLMHVNVIGLHGYRSGCISQSFGDAERGFFLVLDLLFDTCDKRLCRWRREKDMSRLSIRRNPDKHQLRERIEDVALGKKANELLLLHCVWTEKHSHPRQTIYRCGRWDDVYSFQKHHLQRPQTSKYWLERSR
jgi:hypothetical protein